MAKRARPGGAPGPELFGASFHGMNAGDFVEKWLKVELTERAAAQQHFLDLCEVFGHPKPAEVDPKGEWFTFEKGVKKARGGQGWADVWKRGQFAWEYKKRHKNLDAAFDQLLQYVGDLENPPLLVACDMDTIAVRTHFTGYPSTRRDIRLTDFEEPKNLEFVRRVFHDPASLQPEQTIQKITEDATKKFTEIAASVRERQHDPTRFAHFLDRLVFCMFAEDAGLLPPKLLSDIFENPGRDPRHIAKDLADLFAAMAHGGSFWGQAVRHFNGNLFDDSPILDLDPVHFATIKEACAFDWSQMDPSIFGTLFERVMDPSQRSQLGAHYTGFDDIRALVEPVVMAPLRRDWEAVRDRLATLLPDPSALPLLSGGKGRGRAGGAAEGEGSSEAQELVEGFLARLRAVRVLDPACGSGNFLYVTLRLLKDLEKAVLVECRRRGLPTFELAVGPHQLLGIEKNPYAFDLAQMTVWIGDLQWRRNNGFPVDDDPVLRPLDTIRLMDAILDDGDPDNPREPEWPDVDFIVGNPPFLGSNEMEKELGEKETGDIRKVYKGRIPGSSNLCCYWLEKSRAMVAEGRAKRAGLLGTATIRQVNSRRVLDRIDRDCRLFFVVSNRRWVQKGASVRICMVAFSEKGGSDELVLDSVPVDSINVDFTSGVDTTRKKRLSQNLGLSFMGTTKVGEFDIDYDFARKLLLSTNPHGRPNSDVVRPFRNGNELVENRTDRWIIDFGVDSDLESASLYEAPFEYLKKNVKEGREKKKRRTRAERWWLLGETLPKFRRAISGRGRYLATGRVIEHRIFLWLDEAVLPDSKVIAFALFDDYHLGLLQSRVHEVWTLRIAGGHGVGDCPTYNNKECFETFPFPEPTAAQHEATAAAARRLDELRSSWLNPPEWVRREVLEFPGSADGPWARFVHDPNERGIGTVRYPRLVPKDAHAYDHSKRTLTNLYNDWPAWLELAHRALDEAVFSAYGWESDLSDDEVLGRLLRLNLERHAAAQP